MSVPDIGDPKYAWHWLLERAEDAMAAGLTAKGVRSAVEAAISSLEADRLTAEDLGRHDPYPHLGGAE